LLKLQFPEYLLAASQSQQAVPESQYMKVVPEFQLAASLALSEYQAFQSVAFLYMKADQEYRLATFQWAFPADQVDRASELL
jgi:hypothetical protein